MSAVPYVWWRGRRFTPAMRDAIVAAENRAGFTFTITQGGFNSGGVLASAGTHDGDALDLSVRDLTEQQVAVAIDCLRWAGIAAWFRTTKVGKWGTRPHGFSSYHIHGVPNGWGSPSRGARDQAAAYRAGRDGLASNGVDAGPGHTSAYRNRTTPGKPAAPNLPVAGGSVSSGAGSTTPTTPKEDALSAAEVAEIKAHIDAKFRDLQANGFDRAPAQFIAKEVWDNSHVYRGADKKPVSVKQELADAKSLAMQAVAQNAALAEAQLQLAKGGRIDYDRMGAVVRDAIEDTIKIGGKQ